MQICKYCNNDKIDFFTKHCCMNCRRERDNTYQNTKRKIEKKYEEIMDHKKK